MKKLGFALVALIICILSVFIIDRDALNFVILYYGILNNIYLQDKV